MEKDFIIDIIGKDIEIKRDDIIPYVYFVCSMANKAMYGGIGSKSDYIGGIFDRWINIIPESIIFNKCILPCVEKKSNQTEKIRVYSDFYKYDPKVVGIAPDVIGLQKGSKIIPFVKYDDKSEEKNYWIKQENCPLIEVKSFKENQYMVTLRNQNYSGKYLVMVSTKLSIDYLLPFFNEALFIDDNIKDLHMPSDFIISNEKGLLEDTKKISFAKDNLGTLKLLSITTADDFMSVATKCLAGESPRYFKNVRPRKINNKNEPTPLKDIFSLQENGLYRLNNEVFGDSRIKTLDISISDIDSLEYISKTKTDIIIKSNKDDIEINGSPLKAGFQYNIEFGIIDRGNDKEIDQTSDNGSEYFMNKTVVNYLPTREEELINNIISAL